MRSSGNDLSNAPRSFRWTYSTADPIVGMVALTIPTMTSATTSPNTHRRHGFPDDHLLNTSHAVGWPADGLGLAEFKPLERVGDFLGRRRSSVTVMSGPSSVSWCLVVRRHGLLRARDPIQREDSQSSACRTRRTMWRTPAGWPGFP